MPGSSLGMPSNCYTVLQGLWDAPIFYPYPKTLTYSENLLGIAVLTAPVQWLTGNPVLGYNIAFLFSYVLAGSGMYLLAVSITGNRLAAVVSGVAFAFLPYRVAQLPHLQMLMFGWMPIGLWAFPAPQGFLGHLIARE